jgi:hypothetical protein
MAKVVSLLPDFLEQSSGGGDPEPEPDFTSNGEPTFNAVIVSGAGTDTSNGTYVLSGEENGRNKYVSGSNTITWEGFINWFLFDGSEERNTYGSQNDVSVPWDAIWEVEDADEPAPTLTPTNV